MRISDIPWTSQRSSAELRYTLGKGEPNTSGRCELYHHLQVTAACCASRTATLLPTEDARGQDLVSVSLTLPFEVRLVAFASGTL